MDSASAACAVGLCAVCAAKLSGARVPKRKCTCKSGDTAARNTGPKRRRWEERQDRWTPWRQSEIMFGAPFYDLPEEEWHELHDLAYSKVCTSADGLRSYTGFMEVCRSDDLVLLESLGTRGCNAASVDWRLFWREAASNACKAGQRDVLRYLLCISSVSASDLCPYEEPLDFEPEADPEDLYEGNPEDLYDKVPNPAPLLWIAAKFGHADLVDQLVEHGADPNQPAYDGTTPFWVACESPDMAMVRRLHILGVDMLTADQDGTAPVHIAALCGNLEVIQFLHQQGVSMETPGSVYLDTNFNDILVNVTALKIAQRCNHTVMVQFLQPAADQVPAQKRQRMELPMHERAARVGVTDRLKPIPPALEEAIKSGSPEECAAAKKQKKQIQSDNQKIVSRAEAARMKQTTLNLVRRG